MYKINKSRTKYLVGIVLLVGLAVMILANTLLFADTVPVNYNSEPDYLEEGDDADDQFGYAIAVGDFNGDGIDDVAIGAPYYYNSIPSRGRVLVYKGTTSGLPSSPNSIIYGPITSTGSEFGMTLTSDDYNNDGYDDLIIGAPQYDESGNYKGAAYIYKGTSGNFSYVNKITGSGTNSNTGYFVQSVGDINGDGYPDIGVTHRVLEDVDFYLGDSTDVISTTLWDTRSTSWSINGQDILIARDIGDTDDDGKDDVLIGVRSYRNPSNNKCIGRADLYLGSTSMSWTPEWTAYGQESYSTSCTYFGQAVTGLGDIDSDGYPDFGVAYGAGKLVGGVGRGVQVYSGYNPVITPTWQITRTGTHDFAHFAVGGYDLNYDGNPDILVNGRVPYHNPYQYGILMSYQGDGTAFEEDAAWYGVRDSTTASSFIATLGKPQTIGVGDFDDDGLLDVVNGSPRFANGQTNEGAISVWYNQGDRPITGLSITHTVPVYLSGSTFTATVTGGDNVVFDWTFTPVNTDSYTGTGSSISPLLNDQFYAIVTATNNTSSAVYTKTITATSTAP